MTCRTGHKGPMDPPSKPWTKKEAEEITKDLRELNQKVEELEERMENLNEEES